MTADETRQREMLRLVESEQTTLQQIISGVLANGTAVRVAGFAVWSALIGFAVQGQEALLTLVAGAVLLAFASVDAYHGYLYDGVLAAAVNNDELLRRWYAMQGREAGDEDAQQLLQAKLEAHTFGAYRRLQKQPARPQKAGRHRHALSLVGYVRSARPRLVFAWLYPALLASTLIAGLLLAVLSGG